MTSKKTENTKTRKTRKIARTRKHEEKHNVKHE